MSWMHIIVAHYAHLANSIKHIMSAHQTISLLNCYIFRQTSAMYQLQNK